jgi:acylphosphatase
MFSIWSRTMPFRQPKSKQHAGVLGCCMKKQVHVFYSGRVQGVGFRVTAEETAVRLGVVGWVQNLRDGRVELRAEADEKILVRFLKEMQIGPMRNFIKHVDVTWDDSTDDFDQFEIRYF